MNDSKPLTPLQRVVTGELPAVFLNFPGEFAVFLNLRPQPWALIHLVIAPRDPKILGLGKPWNRQRKALLSRADDVCEWLLWNAPVAISGQYERLGTKLMMNLGRAAGQTDDLPHAHVILVADDNYPGKLPDVMPEPERQRIAAPWQALLD